MAENPVLKKLKLSNQNPVSIINAPDEYAPVLQDIRSEVHTTPDALYSGGYEFVHVFVRDSADVAAYLPEAADSVDPAGYFWVSYPKKSSKKYSSDISRDSSWDVLGERNFEPVTQVSIDADWSALRFRPVDQIKKMTRKDAISAQGRKRIEDQTSNDQA